MVEILAGLRHFSSYPNAIVFLAALFLGSSTLRQPSPIAIQFVVLGALFLVIDGSSVFLCASTAGRLSTWLSQKGRIATQRRTTGSVLLGAAAALLRRKHAPTN